MKKKKRGCKGIDFGGNPHLLDAMIIMKHVWEYEKGKYAIVDGIKLCWRKSGVIHVYW